MNRMVRVIRHLCMTTWQVRRAIPSKSLDAIEVAVQKAELGHSGQIRVVIEGALPAEPLWRNLSSRERATDVFSLMRVWDTDCNNGVLLYLLLADHSVEIIADRGIAQCVPQEEWRAVCQQMGAMFRNGQFEQGIIVGIQVIAAKLIEHFPGEGTGANELSDKPTIL
ncbi:MAG: TPM domain-containing protein [Pseudomonadota bacterium]